MDVMFGRVARHDQVLQHPHQVGNKLGKRQGEVMGVWGRYGVGSRGHGVGGME